MRKIKFVLLAALFGIVLASGCKKDTHDAVKQLETDDQLIRAYLTANSIEAIKHQSGVYYQILAPGTGNFNYDANTIVRARYTGKFLSGSVFDENKTETGVRLPPLGRLIVGWQIGIPLIQPGGRIRLFVPSGYGYGPQASNGMPANSVLDFDIELLGIEITQQ